MDAFAISFLISGIVFSMTLYQQSVHGFSPIQTGAALLPMVMMVGAPVSGILVNRTGSSRLISAGLAVVGLAAFLFPRSSPEATYLDIVLALMVMGLGMSLFSPMTTAVLNSVETAKSGVASAINGAVREIGTAFRMALLGTLMNRAYQSSFNEASEVQALRTNPEVGPLRLAIDAIGGEIGLGGRVIEDRQLFPGLEAYPDVVSAIRTASSRAFIAGMDTAMIVSGVSLLVVAVLSYFLINDRVAATPVEVAVE